jgi:hypothetical protein
MSSPKQTTTNTTLLNSVDDWETWSNDFRTQVKNADLVEHVFQKAPLLTKPVRPTPGSDYEIKPEKKTLLLATFGITLMAPVLATAAATVATTQGRRAASTRTGRSGTSTQGESAASGTLEEDGEFIDATETMDPAATTASLISSFQLNDQMKARLRQSDLSAEGKADYEDDKATFTYNEKAYEKQSRSIEKITGWMQITVKGK